MKNIVRNNSSKSLINVIALKVPKDAKITITASGDDEVLAMEEVVKCLSDLR